MTGSLPVSVLYELRIERAAMEYSRKLVKAGEYLE
jgi:hypothetical protein